MLSSFESNLAYDLNYLDFTCFWTNLFKVKPNRPCRQRFSEPPCILYIFPLGESETRCNYSLFKIVRFRYLYFFNIRNFLSLLYVVYLFFFLPLLSRLLLVHFLWFIAHLLFICCYGFHLRKYCLFFFSPLSRSLVSFLFADYFYISYFSLF